MKVVKCWEHEKKKKKSGRPVSFAPSLSPAASPAAFEPGAGTRVLQPAFESYIVVVSLQTGCV